MSLQSERWPLTSPQLRVANQALQSELEGLRRAHGESMVAAARMEVLCLSDACAVPLSQEQFRRELDHLRDRVRALEGVEALRSCVPWLFFCLRPNFGLGSLIKLSTMLKLRWRSRSLVKFGCRGRWLSRPPACERTLTPRLTSI